MNSFTQAAGSLLDKIVTFIIDPLILLIFSVGFLLFVWGMVVYMYNLADKEGDKRKEGQKHMIYGLIGMFIMVAVGGIIRMIDDTFGLNLNNAGQGIQRGVTPGSGSSDPFFGERLGN